jgi:hypothetical protein
MRSMSRQLKAQRNVHAFVSGISLRLYRHLISCCLGRNQIMSHLEQRSFYSKQISPWHFYGFLCG